MTSPVRARTSSSCPASRSSSQRAAVRRSCQTSALWTGSPVEGSQATTVSRWLVIPIESRLAASARASASAGEATRLTPSQISLASCSTQPGLREVLGELAVGTAADPALAVEDETGRPGRPLIDRQNHPRARLSAPCPPRASEVAKLARAVHEPGQGPAGGAVLELELELDAPGSRHGRRRSSSRPPSRTRSRTEAPRAGPRDASPAGPRSGRRPRSRSGCGSPSAQSRARPRSRRRAGAGRPPPRGRLSRRQPPRPARPAHRPRCRGRRRRRGPDRGPAAGRAPPRRRRSRWHPCRAGARG